MCSICHESYNDTNRRPLLLPCGHSNCKQCLYQIECIGSKACSYCRTEWEDKKVTELPVCYQLINHEILIGKAAGNATKVTHGCAFLCIDHNFNYLFWCGDCQAEACKICLIEKHVGCKVDILEDAGTPEYVQFNKAVVNIRARVSQKNAVVTSCIKTNWRRLRDIQKFIETLKSQEKKLRNHHGALKVQQSEIRDNLNLLDAKLDDGNVHNPDDFIRGKILAELPEEKAAIRRMDKPLQLLDKPKSLTLDRVTTAYQVMEDDPSDDQFITAFSRLCSSRASNNTIVVDNNFSASAALLCLFLSSREPQLNCLVLAKPTSVPQLTRVKLLLPLIAKLCGNEIRIRLLDSFWGRAKAAPNAAALAAIEPDSERLGDFLASVERVKLRELYGSLDHATMRWLNGLSLDAIGLTVSTADDIQLINNISGKPNTAEDIRLMKDTKVATMINYTINLKNLHVSIITEVNSCSLIPLRVFTSADLSHIRCFLHFPRLADERLPWMIEVVSKLVPFIDTSQRLDALCLPDCKISTGGAEMILSFLQRFKHRAAHVYLDDKNGVIGADDAEKLRERYQNCGIELEFEMEVWLCAG